MKCKNCGSERLELLGTEGVVERFKCLVCGELTLATAIYSPSRLFEYADENDVFLVAEIHEVISRVQLMKLRAAIPDLKGLSVDLLEKQLLTGKLDFGRQHKAQVDLIRSALDGVRVRYSLHIHTTNS